MTDFVNNAKKFPAFVIKNYIPMSQKVEIVHYKYGKIICIFPKFHQAALLCSGSLIFCTVEKFQQSYRFLDLSVEFSPHGFCIEELQFIHDIMKLFQQNIPRGVRVPEMFDFLLYVYHNLSLLSDEGRMVVLLRFFLLLDLLPEHQEAYQAAVQDPYNLATQDSFSLQNLVSRSWDNFYQFKKP